MEEQLRHRMIFHGAVVILLGLLSGFPFALVATEQLSGELRAWHMAHMEGVINGLLVIAVAAAAARFQLTEGKQKLLAWSLVIMAYGNAVASILAATFGVRGLQPVGPAMNLVVYAIFTVAVVGVLIGIGLTAQAARRAGQS